MPVSRTAHALTAAFGIFLVGLDNTIVNVALTPIAASFHCDLRTVQWIVTAYFLAQAAVIPAAGYLSRHFGLKRLYLVFLSCFTLSSLLCGLTHDAFSLIAMRVLQGLAGGGLLPLAQATILGAFSPEERARTASLFSLPVLLAPSFGPTIGGYLTYRFGWHSIFLLNLPVGAAVFALTLRNFPADPAPSATRDSFDWTGLTLSMLGAVALSYGVSGPAHAGEWLIAGAIFFAGFTFHALGRGDAAVLDLRVLRRSDFTISGILALVHGALFFGSMFLIPVYLQQLHRPLLSAKEAGLLMMPQGLGSALAVACNGWLFHRFGPRRVLIGGTVLLATSSLLIAGAGAEALPARLVPILFLRGIAFSSCFWVLQANAFQRLSRAELPKASSLFHVSRQIFSSCGLTAAIGLLGAETVRFSVAGAGIDAGVDALRVVFEGMAGVSLLLLLLSPWVAGKRLPEPELAAAPSTAAAEESSAA